MSGLNIANNTFVNALSDWMHSGESYLDTEIFKDNRASGGSDLSSYEGVNYAGIDMQKLIY